MRDDEKVSRNDRPVDPLIARREASVLDLTPPGTQPTFARDRRGAPPHDEYDDEYRDWDDFDDRREVFEEDGYGDEDAYELGEADGTDGFGLFDEGPEPVAVWDRSPAAPRAVPPQLKVLAAVVATVAVIWAIAAVRGPSEDGTPAPTGTTVIAASLALGSVQQNAGATTVDATLTSAAGVDEVLSNHVWIVRDGVEFPEAIAFVGCLAVDDQLDKAFTGTFEVVTPVNDASSCGVGGFALAPGGTATVKVTALGLAPGAYRVLLAAWMSEPFTVV